MKRTTKKLSGIGLELFLRRFYASFSDIDDRLARRLSKDSARTFASVRVRHIAWRDRRPKHDTLASDADPVPNKVPAAPDASSTNPPAQPPSPVLAAPTINQEMSQTSVATENSDAPFDPYAIGLIPTYQREGPDGLDAKLSTITSLDNLRKMARSQQVALPAELRGADADIDDVRSAIIAAVGKRIANRRAAAG